MGTHPYRGIIIIIIKALCNIKANDIDSVLMNQIEYIVYYI